VPKAKKLEATTPSFTKVPEAVIKGVLSVWSGVEE